MVRNVRRDGIDVASHKYRGVGMRIRAGPGDNIEARLGRFGRVRRREELELDNEASLGEVIDEKISNLVLVATD